MLEVGAHQRLKDLVRRDYETFSGFMLERYFRQNFAEWGTFTRIGSWWSRKGENEIDLIAEDELEKKAVFAEVKRKQRLISPLRLQEKAKTFLKATGAFKGYSIAYEALSVNDM